MPTRAPDAARPHEGRDDRPAPPDIVAHGPSAEEDWAEAVAEGRFFGVTELVHADGRPVTAQWAASTETVTGHRLVLFVALSVSR